MSTRHFEITFESGLRCRITFDPAIHWDDDRQVAKPIKEWTPKPLYKGGETAAPQYIKWRHTVNAEIAKIVQRAHTCVFTDSHAKHISWSAWRYYPNGRKKRIDGGDGPFPYV